MLKWVLKKGFEGFIYIGGHKFLMFMGGLVAGAALR
jgi:hypothetical protein